MIEDKDNIRRGNANKLVLTGQEYEKYKTAIIHFTTQSDKSNDNI